MKQYIHNFGEMLRATNLKGFISVKKSLPDKNSVCIVKLEFKDGDLGYVLAKYRGSKKWSIPRIFIGDREGIQEFISWRYPAKDIYTFDEMI